MKTGDLIYWHGYGTIALVIDVELENEPEKNGPEKRVITWVRMWDDEGFISDSLEDGYTIIEEGWDWPEWHVNHKDNICKSDL